MADQSTPGRGASGSRASRTRRAAAQAAEARLAVAEARLALVQAEARAEDQEVEILDDIHPPCTRAAPPPATASWRTTATATTTPTVSTANRLPASMHILGEDDQVAGQSGLQPRVEPGGIQTTGDVNRARRVSEAHARLLLQATLLGQPFSSVLTPRPDWEIRVDRQGEMNLLAPDVVDLPPPGLGQEGVGAYGANPDAQTMPTRCCVPRRRKLE